MSELRDTVKALVTAKDKDAMQAAILAFADENWRAGWQAAADTVKEFAGVFPNATPSDIADALMAEPLRSSLS